MSANPLRRMLMLLFLIGFGAINAQTYKIGASINGGITDDGFGGIVTFDYKLGWFDYAQLGLQGYQSSKTASTGDEIDVSLSAVNLGVFIDLIGNNNRKIALYLGGGLAAGMEQLNEGEELLPSGAFLKKAKYFIYGGFVGADLDIFIVPTLTLNIKANQYYHINSELGSFNPYAGVGIKLILL